MRHRRRPWMCGPVECFTYPEPEGRFLGVDLHEIQPLVQRLRDCYNQLGSGDEAMLDFDERDLLELAHEAGFPRVDVKLEARIERGRIWGSEPPPLDRLLATAPNPNAPTFQEVLAAEFTANERERF